MCDSADIREDGRAYQATGERGRAPVLGLLVADMLSDYIAPDDQVTAARTD